MTRPAALPAWIYRCESCLAYANVPVQELSDLIGLRLAGWVTDHLLADHPEALPPYRTDCAYCSSWQRAEAAGESGVTEPAMRHRASHILSDILTEH
ncbi:hypothetical protein [Streptacidiphilus cavernicola]|uniref:Uncharacterized protein n=1 Tax=Streptacidiphilus cavernicola TaxID=3342716 RepID=A0ABV6VY20_9ACTN